MRQTIKIILASALATAALIEGVPAHAEPTGDVNVHIVATADLDLAKAADQRRLERRLAVAAHDVCDGSSAADLKASNEERSCRAKVLQAAHAQAAVIAARNGVDAIVLASGK